MHQTKTWIASIAFVLAFFSQCSATITDCTIVPTGVWVTACSPGFAITSFRADTPCDLDNPTLEGRPTAIRIGFNASILPVTTTAGSGTTTRGSGTTTPHPTILAVCIYIPTQYIYSDGITKLLYNNSYSTVDGAQLTQYNSTLYELTLVVVDNGNGDINFGLNSVTGYILQLGSNFPEGDPSRVSQLTPFITLVSFLVACAIGAVILVYVKRRLYPYSPVATGEA